MSNDIANKFKKQQAAIDEILSLCSTIKAAQSEGETDLILPLVGMVQKSMAGIQSSFDDLQACLAKRPHGQTNRAA